MTEQEWLACKSPLQMLADLGNAASGRKLRLFTCACCRRMLPTTNDSKYQRVIEIAERIADGQASEAERLSANAALGIRRIDPFGSTTPESVLALVVGAAVYHNDSAYHAAEDACRYAYFCYRDDSWRLIHADLLRDIFNLFRPVTFSPEWRTDTAIALARQMYDSRDFSAMPILSDALQDAGCDNEDILSHCRGPGPHVRGCWCIDACLGKE